MQLLLKEGLKVMTQELRPQEPDPQPETVRFEDVPAYEDVPVYEDVPAQEEVPVYQQSKSFDEDTSQFSQYPVTAEEPAEEEEQNESKKSSWLLAGLAIGSLVGALVGGATGAVVSSNTGQTVVTTATGPVTINPSGRTTPVTAIAHAATQSVVTLEVTSAGNAGTGSGVIYSENGYIITNAHVVTMPDASLANTSVKVFMSDGTILNAKIVGTDPYADIAVVKVDAEGLPAVRVGDSEKTRVGDLAVAIGAPFNLSNTVTSGVVSTVYRGIGVGSPLLPKDENAEETPWNFDFGENLPGAAASGGQVTLPVIQTDADINPGNSGGALLNERAELIGINVAIASTGSNDQRAGSVGLGFAIPSSLATRVADSLIAGNPASHGLLGATVEDSRATSESSIRGGLVRDVIPGGAAEKAGIQAGDIITAVEGIPTIDGTSVSAMVRYFESGQNVEIQITRANGKLVKDVTLGSLV